MFTIQKFLVITLLLSSIMIFHTSSAQATSCIHILTEEEEYAQATVVFEGVLIDREHLPSDDSAVQSSIPPYRRYTFRITKLLKGTAGETLNVQSRLFLELGDTYRVYADGPKENLTVHSDCSTGARPVRRTVHVYAKSPNTILLYPKSTGQAQRVLYDFVDKANNATWCSYNPTDGYVFKSFETGGEGGAAQYRYNELMENNQFFPKVLHTHPIWKPFGSMIGRYRIYESPLTILAGDKFEALVGFGHGAFAGDVIFQAQFQLSDRCDGTGTPTVFETSVRDAYDYQLKKLSMVFPESANGKQLCFVDLAVHAGESSGQDWAYWIRAEILR